MMKEGVYMNWIINISNFISENKINVFIDVIMHITIIFGTLWAIFAFKYKYDANVRALYIENSRKMENLFAEFFQTGNVTPETQNIVFEAYREATLYLHKDIVKIISDIKECIIKMDVLKMRLEPTIDDNERKRICDELYELDLKMSDYSAKLTKSYRKHILNDGINLEELKEKLKSFSKNKPLISENKSNSK